VPDSQFRLEVARVICRLYPASGKKLTGPLEVNGPIIGESEVINELPSRRSFPTTPAASEGCRGAGRGSRKHQPASTISISSRAAGARPFYSPQVQAKEKEQRQLIAEKDRRGEDPARNQLEGHAVEWSLTRSAKARVHTLADWRPRSRRCSSLKPDRCRCWADRHPTDGHPKLAAWWTKVQERAQVQKILGRAAAGASYRFAAKPAAPTLRAGRSGCRPT